MQLSASIIISMNTLPLISDFPLKTYDKVRYHDTDRQGHVNNAVFSSFLETGRVEILYNPDVPLNSQDTSFVIASLKLDFLHEAEWPGLVEIGTGVSRIGNSSVVFHQQLFQRGVCVAKAETVIVQVYNDKSGSAPLSEEARRILGRWVMDV